MSTKNGGVKLRVDSRQRHAHLRFGQITSSDLLPETNYGFDLYKDVEPETAVSCTAYSVTKVRSSQTKEEYDINDLWNFVPKTADGAQPEDTISTAKKNGLKRLKDGVRDFGIQGYYRTDTF